MSLSSHHLDAFYVTAQLRSFTAAAARLHITQSALSQRISNLESELGHTLFIRERSGPRLTPMGLRLLSFCRQREALENELVGDVKGLEKKAGLSGTVRVAGFSSVMRSVFLPAVAPLIAKNPRLELEFLERKMRELPSILRGGEADFVVLDHPWTKEGVAFEKIGDEENVLIEKLNYDGPDVYLDYDEYDDITIRYFKQKNRRVPSALKRRFLDDVYAIVQGVELGLGRAVVPRHLFRGNNKVSECAPDVVLKIPVYVHYNEQLFYTELHQAILRCLTVESKRFLK